MAISRLVACLIGLSGLGLGASAAAAEPGDTVAPVIWQPSMNVFRRFSGDAEPVYHFYSEVLGFEPLTTLAVGNGGGGVMRIKAGATELKFTGRVARRSYVEGGMTNATGLRLWTFFFSDEAALVERFEANGLPRPEFDVMLENGRKSAIVTDPDGQLVELVITGDPPGTAYDEVEIGLVVADLERSLAFYRGFVGLEELPAVYDTRFKTEKYIFRNEATYITLRSFGDDLPPDTGSGGIQYVVSNVDHVAELAEERQATVDQPLSGLPGYSLRTIWLDDPDGITNYFAETAQAREAAGR